MNLRNKFEQIGTVAGDGDVLTLIIRQTRQFDDPFQPFPADRRMSFSIRNASFSRAETMGTGCGGERTPVTAEFTRALE
jgi:hypothetical protein